VDILEKEAAAGGLCKSTKRGDFIFDLGGHRFITKDELLLAEVTELMGEDLLVRPRKSAIRLQGKFFSYPLSIPDVFRKINPLISLKTGIDFFLTKIGAYSGLSDDSFENWIVKRFGRTMYEIYFGPYSEKLWGMPPKEISSGWATQRISLVNITDVLLRALGKKKDMPKTYARHFLYPRNGIGHITERMAEEIERKNGKIHLNAEVKKISLKNSRIEEIVYIQDGKERQVAGDFVVSTMPLPEFILDVEPKADNACFSAAEGMKFRSILFLHIMLNREFVTDNTWIYVPEEKYLFFRIQDRRNWSPTTVPPGKNALTMEIACNKNDSVWNMADEEIFQRCISGLEDLKLAKRDQVIDFFTERVEHAYPVYTMDYEQKIKTAYGFLSPIKDFISIGRQGLYRYNNMDHSLKMGILAAKHILYGYPKRKVLEIATENIIFDWQDPGYHDGRKDVIG
jgi:protoporphyrinogen oxidase